MLEDSAGCPSPPAPLLTHPPPTRERRSPLAPITADDLAYILSTSGSTGRPKGVAMRHGAPRRPSSSGRSGPTPRGLGGRFKPPPPSFDVSFQEDCLHLGRGGCLVPDSPKRERRDPAALLARLRAERDRAPLPPPSWGCSNSPRSRAGRALPDTLREVVTAGEQLRITPAVVELFTRPAGRPPAQPLRSVGDPRGHLLHSGGRPQVLVRAAADRAADRRGAGSRGGPRRPAGGGGGSRRAAPRRRPAGPRLPRPAGADGGALRPRSVRGGAWIASLPDRRPGALAAGRRDWSSSAGSTRRSRSAATGWSRGRSRPCSKPPGGSGRRRGRSRGAARRPPPRRLGGPRWAVGGDRCARAAAPSGRAAAGPHGPFGDRRRPLTPADPQRQGGPPGAGAPRHPPRREPRMGSSRRAPLPRRSSPRSGPRSWGSNASAPRATSSSWAAIRSSPPRWSRGCATPAGPSCRCASSSRRRPWPGSPRGSSRSWRRGADAAPLSSAVISIEGGTASRRSPSASNRLWFLERLVPGSPVFNLPLALRLDGRLHLIPLSGAFAAIVRRHEALRTVFAEDGGRSRSRSSSTRRRPPGSRCRWST